MIMRHISAALALSAIAVAAQAESTSWTAIGSTAVSPSVLKDYASLQTNRIYTNGQIGEAVLKLTPQQAANISWIGSGSQPVVFVRYEPDMGAGAITVVRLMRRPGMVLLEERRFQPSDGQRFAAGFNGVNPFGQFAGGPSGTFANISETAMLAAAGLVMRNEYATHGLAAIVNTTSAGPQCSTSGGFFRKTTTCTEQAYTSPTWYLMTPSGIGSGVGDVSYQLGNGDVVRGGINLIAQGANTNLPTGSYLSYNYQTQHSGWSTIGLSILTGGLNIGFNILQGVRHLQFGRGFSLGTGINPFGTGQGTQQTWSGPASYQAAALQGQWDYRSTVQGATITNTDPMSAPGSFGQGFSANNLQSTSWARSKVLESTQDGFGDMSLSTNTLAPVNSLASMP